MNGKTFNGKRLKRLRKAKGMSRTDLAIAARRAGVSKRVSANSIMSHETKDSTPSSAAVAFYAEFFNTTMESFLINSQEAPHNGKPKTRKRRRHT